MVSQYGFAKHTLHIKIEIHFPYYIVCLLKRWVVRFVVVIGYNCGVASLVGFCDCGRNCGGGLWKKWLGSGWVRVEFGRGCSVIGGVQCS
jgi:hypothetical protein